MNKSVVTIERLNNIYFVSAGDPAPQLLQGRLDRMTQERLGTACHELFANVLDDADPSIWLIRSLKLDLALDITQLDDRQYLQVYSASLAAGVTQTLAHGADGEQVLRFANRAAYLAHFLRDVAGGWAWERWYYNQFDRLRSLPASAAIRETLAREPEQAEAALLYLHDLKATERVIDVLTENDAVRILSLCADDGLTQTDEPASRQAVDTLLAVWTDIAVPGVSSFTGARRSLQLYLAARSIGITLVSASLQSAIQQMLGFAEILRYVAEKDWLLERLSRADLQGAIELARAQGVTEHLEILPQLSLMAKGDSDWLARVATIAGQSLRLPGVEMNFVAGRTATFITEYAGIFLLWLILLDEGLEELIEVASGGEPEREQMLRFLLALKCLGSNRALAGFSDPALHLAAGLDTALSFEDLRQFDETVAIRLPQTCQQKLIARLDELGRLGSGCLYAELATLSSGEGVLLLREMNSDAWLWATEVRAEQAISEALATGLKLISESVTAPIKYVLLDGSLSEQCDTTVMSEMTITVLRMVAAAGLQALPLSAVPSDGEELPPIWTERPEAITPETRLTIARYLARHRPATDDLEFFSLAEIAVLPINREWDLFWSLVAHCVMRSFAGRLLGFGWSRAAYLWQNFLSGRGAIRIVYDQEKGDQIEVELPRAPLHLVLRMTGIGSRSYHVPWLNDADVTLTLTDE